MDIRTVFTSVARLLHLLWTSFVGLFALSKEASPLTDIESGISADQPSKVGFQESTDSQVAAEDYSLDLTMDSQISQPQSEDTFIRTSRRVSAVRPVKSRIVDATQKNVRDKRLSIVKKVVITPASAQHPCSVMIEFLPNSIGAGLAPLKPALRALKSPKTRVVQFVLPPTYLPDAEILPAVSRPWRNDNSIDDLFDLFPPPPDQIPPVPQIPHPIRNLIQEAHRKSTESASDRQSSSPRSDIDCQISLSTSISSRSGSVLSSEVSGSCASVDTSATSPPTTPELAQEACLTAGALSCPTSHSNSHDSSLATDLTADVVEEEEPRPLVEVSLCDVDAPSRLESDSGLVDNSELPACTVERGTLADVTGQSNKATAPRQGLELTSLLNQITLVSNSGSSNSGFTLEAMDSDLDVHLSSTTSIAISSTGQLGETSPGNRGTITARCEEISDSTSHLVWRESMEKVLQAFRDAQAEDQDFRDLFYRQSSCYSQSSFASVSALREGDTLESAQSLACIEEALAVRTHSRNASSGLGVSGSSSHVGLGIRDLVQVGGLKNRPASSLHRLSILERWMALGTRAQMSHVQRNCADGEEGESSSSSCSSVDEGRHDLWSDLLELDEYLSPS